MNWQHNEVKSPLLDRPVPVLAAKDIAYVRNGNRLQTLNVYLPAGSTPPAGDALPEGQYHVHVHGGAWRDPFLNATSIEAAVAHAFNSPANPFAAVASINYTLSPFPTHPTAPYDGDGSDPARDAVHPQHLRDVLAAFDLLRTYGLTDDSYLLTSHSCGAWLAMRALLHGLDGSPDAPRPAAILGLNGLYDLDALVDGLDATHETMRDEYAMLLSHAFGTDWGNWPAMFDADTIARRVADGKAPRIALLDQSSQDQLVPMNQKDRLAHVLDQVAGLRRVDGHRCTGVHAAPWEQGEMIWQSLQDVLALLGQR